MPFEDGFEGEKLNRLGWTVLPYQRVNQWEGCLCHWKSYVILCGG